MGRVFVRASRRAKAHTRKMSGVRFSVLKRPGQPLRVVAYKGRKHIATLRTKTASLLQDRARGIVEVGNVNVLHSFRGKGIAEGLYRKLLKVRGVRMSKDNAINSPAIPHIYKKLGARQGVIKKVRYHT